MMTRCLFLTTESISHDEPFSIYHAQFDLVNLVGYLKNYNNPPLFEIILHSWIKLFGISELSVRMLPMLFSSFTVWFIYKIGKEFFDNRIAVIASVLFTFSNMQMWYAHDCRVYSLFLLLTVISFYFFFKLLKEEKLSKLKLICLITANSLILYAHYFGVFVLFLEGLIVVFYYMENKAILKTFFVMVLCCVIAYTPQIMVLFERFSDSAKKGTWLKIPSGLESLYNMIWTFANAPAVAVIAITVLVVSLVKFLVFTNRKLENPFTKYVILWFVFPFFFMFLISYKVPMFLDRYLIFITPAFYLLLALGLSFLFTKKNLFYAAAFILTGTFVFSFKLNPGKKRLVRDTVEFIKQNKNERTIVLGCSTDFITTFAYYYNRDYFQSIEQGKEYGKLENLLKQDNIYFTNHLEPGMLAKIDTFDKIIYLDAAADFSAPNNNIKNDLSAKYMLQEDKFYFELFHIYIFRK